MCYRPSCRTSRALICTILEWPITFVVVDVSALRRLAFGKGIAAIEHGASVHEIPQRQSILEPLRQCPVQLLWNCNWHLNMRPGVHGLS